MNKFLNVVLKESCLDSPFAPKEKSIATAIGTGVAALIGGIAMNAAQNSANRTNLELTSDTNRTNRDIANRSNEMSMAQFNTNLDWLKKQYYQNREWQLEERAYNSPQKQVERLIAAGINPAMISGAGNDSSALSSVGAPSQSSFQTGYAQAGHVEPVNYLDGLSESVGHAFNAYHQNRLVDANTKKTNADAQISRADAATRFMRNVSELRKMWVETEKMKADKTLSDSQRSFLDKQSEDLQNKINLFMKTYDEQIRQMELGNNLLDARARSEERQLKHIDFEESIAYHRLEIERALSASQISLNGAQQSKFIMDLGLIAAQTDSEIARGRGLDQEAIIKQIETSLLNIENEERGAQHEYDTKGKRGRLRKIATYIKDILFTNVPFGANVGTSYGVSKKVP